MIWAAFDFLDGSPFPEMIALDAFGESFGDIDGGVSALVAVGLRVGVGTAGGVDGVPPLDFHRAWGGDARHGADLALFRFRRRAAGSERFLSVFLLHGFGFFLGYFFAKLAGCPETLRRTISIEVGMQNSGLGAALATKHFPQIAMAPVPAAISAVFHSIIGSCLAAWWRRKGSDS